MKIFRPLRLTGSVALLCLLSLSFVPSASAGSATWKLNPRNTIWSQPANWTPATVPNGPDDIATFGQSTKTTIGGSPITVNGIVFAPGASAYTMAFAPAVLQIVGVGITNNSGIVQTFVAATFQGAATAGNLTAFTGAVDFYGTSSAGNASFTSQNINAIEFFDSSTAANAAFTLFEDGEVFFNGSSSAGQATFTLNGATESGFGSSVSFNETSTADQATLIINGGTIGSVGLGGIVYFTGGTAGGAVVTVNAGTVEDSPGGTAYFSSSADKSTVVANGAAVGGDDAGGHISFAASGAGANATLIANGGSNGGAGGLISFADRSTGDMATVKLFGNGTLEMPSLTGAETLSIGSLEGDGEVILSSSRSVAHHLIVGGNNLSTTFAGTIRGTQLADSVTKVGTGALTLTGANTYEESTTIEGGTLLISNTTGSGTGPGPVQVDTGTLGGKGTISGAVTVGAGSGAGAFLAPAAGTKKPVTLTLQSSLTLQADSTYTYTFKARRNQASTDLVIANGVTINGA
ncbi:MAG: autotransporter-associated beta strand repeat-containing protein, partial [Chthoniobacterales bacterium]|nr:autotransporter-associated beta strand repeat-containing protein [Chthoniobacterales bacterium]